MWEWLSWFSQERDTDTAAVTGVPLLWDFCISVILFFLEILLWVLKSLSKNPCQEQVNLVEQIVLKSQH